MFSVIGLVANFIGSIVLLATNVQYLEEAVKRVDPVHMSYKKGLQWIEQRAAGEIDPDENRVYPFDHVVSATWRVWPLLYLIDRNVEQDSPCECEIDIQGGHFKIDGEELSLAENRRTVNIPEPDAEGGIP